MPVAVTGGATSGILALRMKGRVVASKYELESLLGEGGVGQVWRARHRVTKRAHAVKLIAAQGATDTSLERFLREAEAFAHVRHPAVVEILDAGRDTDGTLYLVMELLEGKTLRGWLDAAGRRPWEGADILREALDPLMAAHEARTADGTSSPIVHRDLKPENIFVLDTPVAPPPGQSRPTRVKLLDFGIARWIGTAGPTAAGVTLGTPLYSSPEQVRDPRSVTARADVWSIGVMLHEVFSGQNPFLGTTYFEVVAKIWDADPPPLPAWAPAPLVQLIMECLAKDPNARPADARALAHRIDAVLAQASSSAVPASAISKPRPRLDDASELGTVPTEIVLPLVRARTKSDAHTTGRVEAAASAASTFGTAPTVAFAMPPVPESRSAISSSPKRGVIPPTYVGTSGSGAAPGSGSTGAIPSTRAPTYGADDAAAMAALRKNAPDFLSAGGAQSPSVRPPAIAPSFSAPATAAPAAPHARAKFANEDAPDASALPGYGRAPIVITLFVVLGALGAAGAGAAWYFGVF